MTASEEPADEPLALELAWPLAVGAATLGSALGLLSGWPAFPAAFAALLWWLLERRAQLEPVRNSLMLLAWLLANFLCVGVLLLQVERFDPEATFPGLGLLLERAGPWGLFAGAGMAGLAGLLGRTWAEGVFTPWVWALGAGYLGAHSAERARPDVPGHLDGVLELFGALPAGAALTLVAAVLYSGFSASDDRRLGAAAAVTFAAGLGWTAVLGS